MMKSGAPITGSDRRPLNKAGMDIGGGFLLLFHETGCLAYIVKMEVYTVKIWKDVRDHIM
jgi:hypothetical protein